METYHALPLRRRANPGGDHNLQEHFIAHAEALGVRQDDGLPVDGHVGHDPFCYPSCPHDTLDI